MTLPGAFAKWVTLGAGAAALTLAAAWHAARDPGPTGRSSAASSAPASAEALADLAPDPGAAAPTRAAPAESPHSGSATATAPSEQAQSRLTPEQRAQAGAISQALSQGPTLDGCRTAESSLLAFVRSVSSRSSAWNWALGRARDCLRAPHDYRKDNALLKGLMESFPNDPRVRELAGLQRYDAGQLDEAVTLLEETAEDEGSFEAWESYADAQLSRALEMRTRGESGWQDALLQAEAGAMRALALADEQSMPLALHTVARTQLELGRAADAIQWADRAIAALQQSGSRYQTVMTTELYVFSGQIYFRAGQRDTGMAYMEQGIATAASPQQQADLRRIRDEFLGRYGG